MDKERSFEAGEIIGIFKPYVHSLQYDEFDKRCESCFKMNALLLRCSVCHVSSFCNKKCQKDLWKLHKQECQTLKRNFRQMQSYPSFTFLLLRLMTKFKINDNENPSEIIFGKERNFNNLISHSSKILNDPKKMEDYEQSLRFICTINEHENFSQNKIFELFCKLVINTFSICDENINFIGSGLYIGGSIFNHSCSQNAVAMFNGTELIIRALRKITKGEEITISYIDQMKPTHLRNKQLSEMYYFVCHCAKCNDDALNKDLTTTKCRNNADFHYLDKEGIFQMDCSNKVKCEEILDIFENVKTFEKIKENKEPDQLSSLYNTWIKKREFINDEVNFYSYVHHDLAMELCLERMEWRQAVTHGKAMLRTFKKFFTSPHPGLALHLAKIGKIELNLARPDEAIQYLQQAYDMLGITHGRESETRQEVHQLIVQCQLDILPLQSSR